MTVESKAIPSNVCLKTMMSVLKQHSFLSPNSYNMIQYGTVHLKVLESEGKECQKPSHLHFLLYNAFLALDKSSIHVAIHSIKTTHTLGLRSLPLQFRCRDIWLFIIVNIFSHLPYLHDVIFRHRANDTRFIGIPAEVRNLGSVPSMNKLNKNKGLDFISFLILNTTVVLSSLPRNLEVEWHELYIIHYHSNILKD